MVIWCDMVCLALALAPSCAALHFWCLYIMLSRSYLPRRCDWKDGVFYKSPHDIALHQVTWHDTSSSTWNVRYSPRSNPWDRPVLGAEQAMEGKKAMELQHSRLILVTHETCSTMRGATGVTPQHHQNLRLLRKSNSSFDPKIRDLFPPKEERFEHDPRTIRALSEDNRTINFSSGPRPFAELTSPILAKEKAFGAPATSQNFTKCCACHENWHSNQLHLILPLPPKVTFQHHCNFTKYCACPEKWTLQLHQLLRLHAP